MCLTALYCVAPSGVQAIIFLLRFYFHFRSSFDCCVYSSCLRRSEFATAPKLFVPSPAFRLPIPCINFHRINKLHGSLGVWSFLSGSGHSKPF
ncbi:hypothetical protein K438DRAFT_1050079 [Mycena galopus ATCC 62051]|nr:hypothetical protein K438DRAFT_1050079 [Mycena galopus ATCC 62051]